VVREDDPSGAVDRRELARQRLESEGDELQFIDATARSLLHMAVLR